MVGTQVLSLPSAHTGGELVVEHAGQECAYRGSKTDLTLVAFYADCRHQVTPVRTGYRVTLTFNLLAEPGSSAQVSGPLAELAHSPGRHFGRLARQVALRQLRVGSAEPARYLLDHEYTQRGLSWERLKGADAGRAALLRAAAGQAGPGMPIPTGTIPGTTTGTTRMRTTTAMRATTVTPARTGTTSSRT
ncbi:2OG-Fe(II) oxygenase [Streptomyces sp. SS7]|uniref:2OG-Fe(II) oxygenase n=1 Tax=Streptomyces sp. SS7 TaxID=3108485 RepID=UPI0030EF4BC0